MKRNISKVMVLGLICLIAIISSALIPQNAQAALSRTTVDKICDEILNWVGVQIEYSMESTEKRIKKMNVYERRDIISKNSDYWYNDTDDEWNRISLRLFGKKTSDKWEPIMGDWGHVKPLIKTNSIKRYGSEYKVKTTVYMCNVPENGKWKTGNMTIYLKNSDVSSYGVVIRKIVLKKK